jgi:hypothetical protein
MDELEEGEVLYTLEEAQAHRELMESEKHLTEAKTLAIRELRMWLTSHRVDEKAIAGNEQQVFPLVDRESKGFNIIQRKAMDIIESL